MAKVPILDLSWGDKKIPVKVGYFAMLRMQEETGKKITEIVDKASGFDLVAMAALFYWSVVSACKERVQDLPFTKEDAVFVWEDVFEEFIVVVTEQLMEKKNSKKKEKETVPSPSMS